MGVTSIKFDKISKVRFILPTIGALTFVIFESITRVFCARVPVTAVKSEEASRAATSQSNPESSIR